VQKKLRLKLCILQQSAHQPVKEGELLTKANIWVKRPEKGGILAESITMMYRKKLEKSWK